MVYIVMAYIVMACIVTACIVMVYTVMVDILMVYIAMASTVMAYTVLAYIAMAYIVMACFGLVRDVRNWAELLPAAHAVLSVMGVVVEPFDATAVALVDQATLARSHLSPISSVNRRSVGG